MLWLKALWNCSKRGLKALLTSIVITAGILAGSVVVIFIICLVCEGFSQLIGPERVAAMGAFFDRNGLWMLVGLMGIALGVLAWDAVSSEKKSLQWKEDHPNGTNSESV